ncbi:MAG: transposase [Chthoniobacterales bacterium]|nr:transposase [Chthoniobacterales bacterium]
MKKPGRADEGAQDAAPEFIRSDSGPEFIAKKVCRRIRERGLQTAFIPPGAPWENPSIESFNSRLRHDLLDIGAIGSLAGADGPAKDHRRKYSRIRPHSRLGYQTPAKFAASCLAPPRPTASATWTRSSPRQLRGHHHAPSPVIPGATGPGKRARAA